MKTVRLIPILLPLILGFCLATVAYADEVSCTESTEPVIGIDDAVEAYKDGRIEEALQKSIYISEEFDDPRTAGIAAFMTGHIMGQLMLDGADTFLEKAYALYPLIGDYALFKLAEIHESRGEHEGAADLYRTIYRSYPDSVLQKRLLLKAADSYLAAGMTGEARDTYEDYLSIYPKDKSVPSALYGIGLSYLQEDKISLALDYFKKVWIEYPASPVSWSAKEKISGLHEGGYEPPPFSPTDSYTRGEKLYEAGLYEDALADYKRFLAGNKGGLREKETEAYFKIGMSDYHLRKVEEAERALESFLKNYPGHLKAPEALYWLGRTYLRAGKEDAFIKASKGYLKKYKDKERIPEVLYRLGIIYADRRDITTAASYYDRVMKEYPNSSFAPDSQWAKGWLLYKENKLKKALHVFNGILRQTEYSPYIPQALYWKARVLERMNDPEGMEKGLCQLCRDYRGSFYCLFAMHHNNVACASAVSAVNGVGMEIEGSIAGDRVHEESGTTEDEQDIRVKLLLYLGLKEEAIEEIQLLRPRIAKDKKRTISLASALSEMEEYPMSLKVLYSNFSRDMLYSGGELDNRVWGLMYPTGYSTMVNRYAGENSVDPPLLYALIREESWFNKNAVSPAGAAGLMQLMPQTASTVKGSPIDKDALFDPETNISLGARFFSDLLRHYNGNIIVALAGYNAGPAAVSRWVTERDGFGLDEFIEDIPYKETRNYVKKVFTSYMEYLRMVKPAPIISPLLVGGEQLTHP